MIRFHCPCGQHVRMADQFAGRRCCCTACGASLVIPSATGRTIAPTAPAAPVAAAAPVAPASRPAPQGQQTLAAVLGEVSRSTRVPPPAYEERPPPLEYADRLPPPVVPAVPRAAPLPAIPLPAKHPAIDAKRFRPQWLLRLPLGMLIGGILGLATGLIIAIGNGWLDSFPRVTAGTVHSVIIGTAAAGAALGMAGAYGLARSGSLAGREGRRGQRRLRRLFRSLPNGGHGP